MNTSGRNEASRSSSAHRHHRSPPCPCLGPAPQRNRRASCLPYHSQARCSNLKIGNCPTFLCKRNSVAMFPGEYKRGHIVPFAGLHSLPQILQPTKPDIKGNKVSLFSCCLFFFLTSLYTASLHEKMSLWFHFQCGHCVEC